jgi:hypothetical protein
MTMQSDLAIPSGTRSKPRLILMGEFSSGKSTLSNILLGGATLPMQVTATRLPPVHVSYGEPGAFAWTHAGEFVEVDLSDIASLSPQEYRSLHVTMQSDTLELCDLVDMPGISDPNMPADTWDALVGSTDHVIWCTHATQAWRQSEAAAWDRMRTSTDGPNLLLVTQFDKLRSPRDRTRVLNRVAAETAGKFSEVFPVSLLDAMAAGEDFDAWQASGAHAFMERLVEILLAPQIASGPAARAPAPDPLILRMPVQTADRAEPAAILNVNFDQSGRRQTERLGSADYSDSRSGPRVTPRRVQARPAASDRPRPQRPERAEAFDGLIEPGPA